MTAPKKQIEPALAALACAITLGGFTGGGPRLSGIGATAEDFEARHGRAGLWFELHGRPALMCRWYCCNLAAGSIKGRVEFLSFAPVQPALLPPCVVDALLRISVPGSVWKEVAEDVWTTAGCLATCINFQGNSTLVVTRNWTPGANANASGSAVKFLKGDSYAC